MRSSSDNPGLLVLLQPGLRLKRWLLLLVVGLVLVALGIGYVLTGLYRAGTYPSWVPQLTLQMLPQWARALLFLVLGLGVTGAALVGLYRSAADALLPSGPNAPSLLETIYNYRLRKGGPKVVCVGGGTGMPSVLRGLKSYTSNITAIVTVGDDGGSSGRLRREHGILPPGDFRNNIVALAEVEPLMGRLFQYRFGQGSALEGHSFGNLFVLAMAGITGNFEQALRETSRVLAVKGRILPSTLEDVTVCARFDDGSEVEGESQIPEVGKRIACLYVVPPHPAAQPEAVQALLEADLIVLGPGSLYTSVMPNLLVEGVAKALQQSDALKVYVCNVATQPGETDGFCVEDHVDALVRHLPGRQNPLHVVLAATQAPGAELPSRDVELVRRRAAGPLPGGTEVVEEDLVREDNPLRHDPEKLGRAIMAVFEARSKRS